MLFSCLQATLENDDAHSEDKMALKAHELGHIRMYPTGCDEAEDVLNVMQNHDFNLSSQDEFEEWWSVDNLSQDDACSFDNCPQ